MNVRQAIGQAQCERELFFIPTKNRLTDNNNCKESKETTNKSVEEPETTVIYEANPQLATKNITSKATMNGSTKRLEIHTLIK